MLLALKLRPSYRLAAALLAAHTVGAAAAWSTDLPLALRIALLLVIAASGAAALSRAALHATGDAIVALEWLEDGSIALLTRDGAWHAARLLGTTFVTPGLTVLNLRLAETGRVRHVVLTADSADADEYRRLRMRLRWDRSGESSR